MKFRYFFLLSILGFFASCSEDNEPQADNSQEIELFLTSSVATETFGLNALISTSSNMQNEVIGGRQSICDYTDAGEVEVSSEPSSEVSFSYGYSFDVSVRCDFQIPTALNVSFAYNGSFDGPQLEWDHEGTGDFVISQNNAETLLYNGTYDREGEFALKNFDRDGSSSVDITLFDVVVSPEEGRIVSGRGTFVLEVQRNERSYTAEGTITYNGDGTATLEFNDKSISFNLIDGTRS